MLCNTILFCFLFGSIVASVWLSLKWSVVHMLHLQDVPQWTDLLFKHITLTFLFVAISQCWYELFPGFFSLWTLSFLYLYIIYKSDGILHLNIHFIHFRFFFICRICIRFSLWSLGNKQHFFLPDATTSTKDILLVYKLKLVWWHPTDVRMTHANNQRLML